MKIRQKLLLNILLKSPETDIETLSEEFNVSSRTIRNDIDEISYYLIENLKKDVIRVKNGNVILKLNDEDRKKVNHIYREQDYYSYKLSNEERIFLILLDLITNEGYITISFLCEKLYVSRATINSDILAIKKWSKEQGINLITTKGKGLKINESEKERRHLLLNLVRYYTNIMKIGKSEDDYMEIYSKLFNHVNLNEIRDVIIEAEDKFNFLLSDIAFDGLLIHLALSIERNIDREITSLDIEKESVCVDNKEYKMAEYMISNIERKYDISLPAEEIYYVALHIYGKVSGNDSVGDKEWLYIQLIINNLIEKISRKFKFDFRSDLRLYEDLSKHIAGTIFRFKNNLILENPLKDSLIDEYYLLYISVKENCKKIMEYLGQELSDDEITYIVLHFAAAMERISNDQVFKVPSVIVVCSTGVGTSKLVLSRLNKYFNFNIKKVIALHNLKRSLLEEKVDFIVSTVKISEDFPNVVVSPLLKESDIENINSLLFKLGFHINRMTSLKSSELSIQIKTILDKYGEVGMENKLKKELLKLLQDEEKVESQLEGGKVLMLSEVLKEEYISLGDECNNWIDAVKASGNVLVKNSVIDKDYIDSAINNVKELGPYIVITKGVAIPHASNKYGVYKTAISLIRLKEPVTFCSSENDPVKYVFMLATIDSNSHVLALADLVNLLEDKEFYKCIDDAKSSSEIIEYIKQNETKV
ncbi:BglG family transcription antiterminator [Clostridium paraputrificum]|uniref:BglG family transcription antiterminator n=1 Tax=Clostridium paraputrificum TaxID=29363 RepID=UPI0006685BBD|nr:BglG family transcription antiterminator [Clostridium paraputrificum]MDB2107107.1 BglG family transcription antiterminator [Clostridium paraputrificum]